MPRRMLLLLFILGALQGIPVHHVEATNTHLSPRHISARQAATPSTPPPSTSTPPVDPCQSLVHYAEMYSCHSSQCAGVQCNESCASPGCVDYASLAVERCTDPVKVTVTIDNTRVNVTNYEGVFFVNGVSQADDNVLVIFTRNATFLTFTVSVILEGFIPHTILPYGVLPLNASDCMCQSLSEVADAIVLPSNPLVTFDYTCQRMQNCSGVHCDISYSGSSVSADALVDPCAETLHLVMSDSTGGSPLFDRVITDSESVPLDLGSNDITSTLDVAITHKSYSMLLKISMTISTTFTGDQEIPILPEHQIILDRSSCSQHAYPTQAPTPTTTEGEGGGGETTHHTHTPSHATTPTTTTTTVTEVASPNTTTPNTSPPSGATTSGSDATNSGTVTLPVGTGGSTAPPVDPCQSLVHYAELHPHCHSSHCAGVQCNESSCVGPGCVEYASLAVERCTDPVKVTVTIDNTRVNITNYERVFFENGGDAGLSDNNVMVALTRNATFLVFSVSAIYEGDIVIPILPYGELPLNASDCMCQSLSEVADAIVLPSNPLVTFVYTCQRMQNCSGVHCDISYSGSSVSADALVDPCAETLHLVMSDSTGSSPLFDQVFADSESVPLDLGSSDITGTLDVGITHKRYSMLLKISMTISTTFTGDQDIPVLPEHQIILDRSSCSHPDYHTTQAPVTKPGTGATTKPSGSTSTVNATATTAARGGSTLAVKVSVPVVLLVCVLLAAVVVGVVLSKPLYRRCKSKRQYNFQRMRFRAQSDVLENDGDGGE